MRLLRLISTWKFLAYAGLVIFSYLRTLRLKIDGLWAVSSRFDLETCKLEGGLRVVEESFDSTTFLEITFSRLSLPSWLESRGAIC
jgi:hypothetical protein